MTSSPEVHIQGKCPGILSDIFQTPYLVTAEEMKNLQIEVKAASKSGGTKQKLSKSGILNFGGNCGPNSITNSQKGYQVLVCTKFITM